MKFDAKHGYTVYPDATANSYSAKTPLVDYGTARIDPKRYYSHEEMELEWQKFWTRAWGGMSCEGFLRPLDANARSSGH